MKFEDIKKLHQKKYRDEFGCFLVEGEHLVQELQKAATRDALSGTTMARWRDLSWVATPVGQRSVWQAWAWTQPMANMKPRAALHQSAPSAITRAISNAVTILPEAPSLM